MNEIIDFKKIDIKQSNEQNIKNVVNLKSIFNNSRNKNKPLNELYIDNIEYLLSVVFNIKEQILNNSIDIINHDCDEFIITLLKTVSKLNIIDKSYFEHFQILYLITNNNHENQSLGLKHILSSLNKKYIVKNNNTHGNIEKDIIQSSSKFIGCYFAYLLKQNGISKRQAIKFSSNFVLITKATISRMYDEFEKTLNDIDENVGDIIFEIINFFFVAYLHISIPHVNNDIFNIMFNENGIKNKINPKELKYLKHDIEIFRQILTVLNGNVTVKFNDLKVYTTVLEQISLKKASIFTQFL